LFVMTHEASIIKVLLIYHPNVRCSTFSIDITKMIAK